MITNIFQYLQDTKGKPIPFKYKLLNNLPLNESDLSFNGELSLGGSKITHLPDNLTINGFFGLSETKISLLPNNLTVKGNLNINLTQISELPDNLIVNGWLCCFKTPLAENIKNDKSLLEKYKKQIKGEILYGSDSTKETVSLSLITKLLDKSSLSKDDLIINRNLYLGSSKLTSLPDNLIINGDLELAGSKMKQLPNNLTIKGNLNINLSEISELPEDLYVEDSLYCYGTPLGKRIENDKSLLEKYSKQIKRGIYYVW